MFIQTEATPNPATLKFIPGRVVLDGGTMEFANRESAARSPLAERLFEVPGVTGVFYGSDFITVTKDGGDITFRGFKDGIVYLNLKGACSGCPSSTATLQHGIQNLLRHFVPDVVEVRPM